MSRIALVLFSCVAICCAFQQSFTYYTERGAQGNSLTLRSKRTDLLSLSPEIIGNYQSYCFQGFWTFFRDQNFTGNWLSRDSEREYCVDADNTIRNFNGSARFTGPPETALGGISFYSLSYFRGDEAIITDSLTPVMPLRPASLFSSGFSNWTFFTGDAFQGNATCFMSTRETHMMFEMDAQLTNINSIIKGCIGTITHYFYAN